ncbi:hypothetical protein HOLleu_33051 [Holothuria leucospilota]|uniref:Uncharacterized protein n=1 Tax=Holothuria leucospilota TaxID=206669 RepID=A0A9Q0YN01_HOLLE|nr:hypothetical protein HOLleu_33051 [Holothuria leucospilota]
MKFVHPAVSLFSRFLNLKSVGGILDKVQLCSDYEQFARTIRIKEFFSEQSEGNAWSRPFSFKPSIWTPPNGRNVYVDAFVEKAREHLNSFLQDEKHTRVKKNIDGEERKAIYDLQNDTSVVVKPSDKGGATVILNRKTYTNIALEQLMDETFYRILPQNPVDINPVMGHDSLTWPPLSRQMTTIRNGRHEPRDALLPIVHGRHSCGRITEEYKAESPQIWNIFLAIIEEMTER